MRPNVLGAGNVSDAISASTSTSGIALGERAALRSGTIVGNIGKENRQRPLGQNKWPVSLERKPKLTGPLINAPQFTGDSSKKRVTV
jgi:hypothetical protein